MAAILLSLLISHYYFVICLFRYFILVCSKECIYSSFVALQHSSISHHSFCLHSCIGLAFRTGSEQKEGAGPQRSLCFLSPAAARVLFSYFKLVSCKGENDSRVNVLIIFARAINLYTIYLRLRIFFTKHNVSLDIIFITGYALLKPY